MNPYSTNQSQDQDGKEDAFRKATADVFEAADFGEPWRYDPDSDWGWIRDNENATACLVRRPLDGRQEDEYRRLREDPMREKSERVVACVNACAGMADPAKEIASLKGERDCLNSELSAICSRANAHDAAEACEVIQGMREVIKEAYDTLQSIRKTDCPCETYKMPQKVLAKLQPFLT